MASKMRSMRLDDETWAWLAEEAGRRGSSRTGVVEALIASARSGVVSEPFAGERAEVRQGRGPIRVDTPSQVQEWALARQAKLNAAKERAS